MKLFAIFTAAVVAAAVTVPGAADAQTKRKKKRIAKQPAYEVNAQGYKCAPGFGGIDCSNIYADHPDPRVNARIISDFRRGLYNPNNW